MSSQYKIAISKTLIVKHAPFNDKLVAYRCELIDEQNSANTQIWEGVTEKDRLPSQENQKPRAPYGCILRKGAVEKANTHGYDTSDFNIYDQISENPFTNLDSNKHERILLKSDSHMLFDTSGKVLPVARHYDYMRGNIHNGKYDLKIALEHLKKHPHIRFKNDSDEILSIPYYNADVIGRSRYLSFAWTPDQETYSRAWEICKKSKEKSPCTYMDEAVYELDLLGLTECGADLYPGGYYKSKEDEDEDEG